MRTRVIIWSDTPATACATAAAIARPLPGETYTTTLANDVEPLQILLNDQFNQMEKEHPLCNRVPGDLQSIEVNTTPDLRPG